MLILLGEKELALGYVETLDRSPGANTSWAVMSPSLDAIRCEPRFKAVIEHLKATDPHAAKVCGAKP